VRPRPASSDKLEGSAGMGKIGRSYPRFDETLVSEGEEPSVTAFEVIAGLVAVFVALGLFALLLTYL
jgi:hypothetical protein